jgi:hypothetical protein
MGLVRCPDCGREISARALFCPGCGAPHEAQQAFAPSAKNSRTVIPVLGIAAIGLGLASMVVPYFAALYVVPATFVCGIVALWQGQKNYGKLSIILALLGLIDIIFVHQNIGDVQRQLDHTLDFLKHLE